MAKRLRIALDVHGLAVNDQAIKQEIICKKYRIIVQVGLIKREFIVDRRQLLTSEQYDEIVMEVHEHGRLIDAEPYAGFLRTVGCLIRSGHSVDLITASKPAAFANVCRWCEKYPILNDASVSLLGHYGDKTEIAGNLDLIVDDNLERLETFKNKGLRAKRFLMSRPHNLDVDVGDVAERIAGFWELRKRIAALANT